MFLKKKFYYFKIISINIILIYFFLYSVEILINYKNKKLFNKTRIYYLNSLKEKNTNKDVFLNFGGYKLIDKKNISLLPLSGYKNSIIVLCLNEFNKPVYYFSDKNGFNNQFNHNVNDYLLIGDSYVHGMCVNNKDNLNAQFKKFNHITSSLGVGGNGPLLEYATFKEYEDIYNYKKIILFITPSNDFNDLNNERNNKILKKYLNNRDFKQNLSNKKNELIKKDMLNSFFGNKTERIFNDFFSIYHFNLKEIDNTLSKIFKKKLTDNNFDYLKDESLDKLFFKIINKFKNTAQEKNKEFYVVFNSLNPDVLYPATENFKELNNLLLINKLEKFKFFLDKEDILFVDFNDYILNNYNKNNVSLMFKKIDGNWDHYTEKGFFELTQLINDKFNK